MSVKRGRELELDFIRVISMFMIIFCHISAEAGMKWGEYFNVGVMIFMFMSGYLSYRKNHGGKWIKDRLKRILPEYFIFLIIYLLVTVFILHARYTAKQILVNLFVLQGLFTESGLPNILHLWFVTYILICYLLTPFAVKMMNRMDWKKLVLVAIILQIAVIPLRIIGIRIVFSRFVVYFIGLYIAAHEDASDKETLYKKITSRIAIPVLILNIIRFAMELSGVQEKLPGSVDMALGLVWQWAHMFLGILLFYVLWNVGHIFVQGLSDGLKKSLLTLSSVSYCVYVVHQVFVYHDYAITRYVSPYLLGIFTALICIAVSTCVLYYLSNGFRKLLEREKA